MSDTDLSAEDIDQCMTLGAGMPMGPIALLDFIGLDVAQAIGQAIGAHVPSKLRQLVRDGDLGRKSGQGFYSYDG
jgi:3-hydroxyacyl-CoA dehydrogenase